MLKDPALDYSACGNVGLAQPGRSSMRCTALHVEGGYSSALVIGGEGWRVVVPSRFLAEFRWEGFLILFFHGETLHALRISSGLNPRRLA